MKNSVRGIDLASHEPVEPLSTYCDIKVLDNGSCRRCLSLPPLVTEFLRSLDSDVSLWDCTNGHFGRDLRSHLPQTQPLTPELARDLRSRYLSLMQSLAPMAALERRRQEREKHARTQTQLHQSVVEMQRKMERVRRRRDFCEIGAGKTEVVDDLDDRLDALQAELAALQQVEVQMQRKVTQAEIELEESETGLMRRTALLRRLFGKEPLRGGLLAGFCEGAEEVAVLVNAADEEGMACSRRLQQAKCFYVDAVTGKSHLFKLESTLKSILENLREAMTGTQPDSSGSAANRWQGEKGPDFRLRYVRRLWNSVDGDFKASLPYIQETSLPEASKLHSGSGSGNAQNVGEEGNSPSLVRQFSFSSPGAREHSIFNKGNGVLQSFTKIELAYALSKRGKIAALHKCAARSYKEVNSVYDVHEEMLKEGIRVLRERTEEYEKCNVRLVALWERLLGL